jgi:hypothetical protein
VSGQRTPVSSVKTLSNQRLKVGTKPALAYMQKESGQTQNDCSLNKTQDLKIVLASPYSVYYLTTTPLLTNTKQAPS